MHTLHELLCDGRRNSLLVGSENVDMKLFLDRPERDEDIADTIEVAREIWRVHYSRPRTHLTPRKDKNEKRGGKRGSLATWKHTRLTALREQASLLTRSVEEVRERADAMGNVNDDKKTKEIAFNDAKRRVHFLENLAEGSLLPNEFTEADQKEARELTEHQQGLKRSRSAIVFFLHMHYVSFIQHASYAILPPNPSDWSLSMVIQ